MTLSEQIDKLQAAVGQKVDVLYVSYGGVEALNGVELLHVEPYRMIEVTSMGIPFIGYGSAVAEVRLAGAPGTPPLYRNPKVTSDYDLRKPEQIEEMVALCFGQEIADQQRAARLEQEAAWEHRKAESDAKAQARSSELIERGVPHVRPELSEQWREYARNNTQDGYSGAVIEATVLALEKLTAGATPEEADKASSATVDGLTGFMAGCVAKGLAHFAPRGEEYRRWWNARYGIAEDNPGVVNPAILTVRRAE